jgi:hypothetical protein
MTDLVIDGGAPAGTPSEPANPAAAQPNAATTDPATGAGEGGEEGQAAQKTFTQAELDEIVQKRIAKAEAKAERRVIRTLERFLPQQAQQQTTQQAQPAEGKPTRAQFASDEAFVDALTDWKLEQRERATAKDRQQQQAQTLTQKTEGIYAEAEKLKGFDREAFDELPLTKPIVEALIDAEAPAQLMHYLVANPAEVERIAKLSPARQAAEIGKLEAKAAASPAKSSSAPAPIKPLASGSGSGPQNPEDMSMAEYEKWREKQRRA